MEQSQKNQSQDTNVQIKKQQKITDLAKQIEQKLKIFQSKKNCIQLQKLLKQEYSLLWTQNEQKNAFQKKLSDIIMTYHRNRIQSLSTMSKINISQQTKQTPSVSSNKIINKIKQITDDGSAKTIQERKFSTDKVLLDDQGFQSCSMFIKQILIIFSKQPDLLITLIKKHQSWTTGESFQSIVKAIVHSFYQNIVDDDIYNKDYFYIIEQSLILIIQNAKNYTNIKLADDTSFAGQIVKEFLQKPQIKSYSKQVVKNTILQISKIDHQISFSKEQLTQNKRQRQNSGQVGFSPFRQNKGQPKVQSPVKDQKIFIKTKLQSTNSKICYYSQALRIKDQKLRLRYTHSQQKKPLTSLKNKKSCSKQLLNYLGITQQIQFPTFVSSTANSQLKKQEEINTQFAAMLSHKESSSELNQDIVLTKNIVLIFFSDLLKMLYSLPQNLRIVCKIYYNLLQKKFQNKKASFYVLAQYVLNLCVIRNFSISQSVGEKSKIGNYVRTNLQTFGNIITAVIRNEPKNIPKSFQYQFTLIVSNLRISLFNYLQQILSIDLHKLNTKSNQSSLQLQQQNRKSNDVNKNVQKIKSYSVCVNMNDIKRLFQMIRNCKHQLKQYNQNQKLVKRIDRIEMVSQGKQIFKQKQDKRTKMWIKPQNAYVMFCELQMPKELSVDYIKYHQTYFKKNKIQKLMKLFLLSIQDLENMCQFQQSQTLVDFILKLSVQPQQYFQMKSSIHIQNIDHVPIEIKIKFLMSLIKKNFNENQYEKGLFGVVHQMYKQVTQRITYYKTIWDKTKQCFLKSLSCVIYLNQNIITMDCATKKTQKSKKLDQFIHKTKISICLTSPKTRQKQTVLKTNIMKDLSDDEKSKIWLENQSRCVHTALNLQFIKSLTGEFDKGKKQYEAHCNSILKFADIFCSLPQIKANQAEDIGVKQAFFQFIKYCCQLATKKQQYAAIFSEDIDWLEQIFQQKLSKKIYDKLYPKDPTYEDIAFYLRLKTLQFIKYENLKIKPELRFEKMWQLAGKQLKMMDKVKTAGQKLECITQFNKIIINSYYLINNQKQQSSPATAQDIYPIVIYVLIKAAPKRMISNINFIELFANQNKLMSKDGYSFTQLKSAIQFCDQLTEVGLEFQNKIHQSTRFVNFNRLIYQKEVEYGIYFLLLRKKTNPEQQVKKLTFLKDYFNKIKSQ